MFACIANYLKVFPAHLNGVAIFLFSAMALIAPSGYSYGPILLLLGCVCLFIKRQDFKLGRQDCKFIIFLFLYFGCNALFNWCFSLPLRSYDGLFRFVLAVPIYILLIKFPAKPIFFWCGLFVGCIGAGFFAIYQMFYAHDKLERASGYMNAIQFGDISVLLAGLLLCGFIWALYSLKNKLLASVFLMGSSLGLLASCLSLSRGGWLALPLIFGVIFSLLSVRARKLFFGAVVLIFTLILWLIFAVSSTNIIKQRFAQTQVDLVAVFSGGVGAETASLNARVQLWVIGFEAFKSRPIMGWGEIAAIKKEFPEQWLPLEAIDNFTHFHNEYIDALAKRGMVGFVLLMCLYLIPLYYFVGLMRSGVGQVVMFAAAGVVLVLCTMVFGLTQTFMAHISGVTVYTFYLVIIAAYCRVLERQSIVRTA